MANARERIEKLISENPVVLFMKGTPEFPQCGFSGQVIQILEYVGAPVIGVNVLEDAEIRQGGKEYANWPTIPPLYVKGECLGAAGCARCVEFRAAPIELPHRQSLKNLLCAAASAAGDGACLSRRRRWGRL